jgi:hypothetical protein
MLSQCYRLLSLTFSQKTAFFEEKKGFFEEILAINNVFLGI